MELTAINIWLNSELKWNNHAAAQRGGGFYVRHEIRRVATPLNKSSIIRIYDRIAYRRIISS
jgi:hypothetical protein